MYLFVFATSETTVGLSLLLLKHSLNNTLTINNFFFKNFFFVRKSLTKHIYSKLDF